MFSDRSMTKELFMSEVGRIPVAGYSPEGLERLWKWYSREVRHNVLFNPLAIACDWAEYPTVVDAVRDLNECYVKDMVRRKDGKRLTEMDLRTMPEKFLLDLLKRAVHVLEIENGHVLVDLYNDVEDFEDDARS